MTTASEFNSRFAEIVQTDASSLTRETALADLEWNSVTYLETMVLVDDLLGLTLTAEQLIRTKTFGDLLDLVSAKFTS